jgi:hypothetical protein
MKDNDTFNMMDLYEGILKLSGDIRKSVLEIESKINSLLVSGLNGLLAINPLLLYKNNMIEFDSLNELKLGTVNIEGRDMSFILSVYYDETSIIQNRMRVFPAHYNNKEKNISVSVFSILKSDWFDLYKSKLNPVFSDVMNDISFQKYIEKEFSSNIKQSIEHELIHFMDRGVDTLNRFNQSDPVMQLFYKNYAKDYYGASAKVSGKVPIEFNPHMWEVVQEIKLPFTPDQKNEFDTFMRNPVVKSENDNNIPQMIKKFYPFISTMFKKHSGREMFLLKLYTYVYTNGKYSHI